MVTGDLCAVWSWDVAWPTRAEGLHLFLQHTALKANGTKGQDKG